MFALPASLLLVLFLRCLPAAAVNKTSKRGLGYVASNNPQDVRNFNQSTSQVSWVYDWGLDRPDYLTKIGVEYIPMQWGAGNIENLAASVKAQGAKTLLGFNEPDFSQQSNIDPTFAAQLWMQHIEPLKAEGIRLGGPAVSSSGTGTPWLTQFLTACSNCTIDFLPFHWYGVGVAGLYDYLFQMHSSFPKYPIWVTEYADTSLNDTEVEEFINQTTTFFDQQDFIERYAWFGYFRPQNGSAYNLLNDDGGLNGAGTAYVGSKTVERSGPVTFVPTNGGPNVPPVILQTISVPLAGATPTFHFSGAIIETPATLRNAVMHLLLMVAAYVFGMGWIML